MKLDWIQISNQPNLSEDFLEENAQHVTWYYVVCNHTLSETLMDKVFHQLCWFKWKELYQNRVFSDTFLEKYKDDIDWGTISYYQTLSEDFIAKYKAWVDWETICGRQTLSETFIETHIEHIDWLYVSLCQTLSEEFIDKYHKKVSWKGISQRQTLSEDFISRFANSVHWGNICEHQVVSFPFIIKHIDRIDTLGLHLNMRSRFTQDQWKEINRLQAEIQEKKKAI